MIHLITFSAPLSEVMRSITSDIKIIFILFLPYQIKSLL